MVGAALVVGVVTYIDPRYTRLWSGPMQPLAVGPGDVTVEMERDALAAALGEPTAPRHGDEELAGQRDALAAAAGFPTGSSRAIPDEVSTLIAADEAVQAVRVVREHSGLGLREAKRLIDTLTGDLEALQDRRRATDPGTGPEHA